MNDYLETEAKDLFSRIKARHIFILTFLLLPLALGFILGVIIGIIGVLYPAFGNFILQENPFLVFLLIAILVYLSVSWLILRQLKASKISFKYILGKFNLKKKEWQTISIAILASQLFFLGINQLTIFFTTLISPDWAEKLAEEANPIFTYDGDDPSVKVIYWLLFFIMVVVVAPIAEEFIFRGVIMHRWATNWGVIPGILLSSFFFGLIHANIFFLNLAVWSIFLALLYVKTGSLIVPIIAHAFNNFLVFVVMFIGDNSSTAIDYEAIAMTDDLLQRGLICIFLASIPLFYLLKFPSKLEHLPYFTNQKN